MAVLRGRTGTTVRGGQEHESIESAVCAKPPAPRLPWWRTKTAHCRANDHASAGDDGASNLYWRLVPRHQAKRDWNKITGCESPSEEAGHGPEARLLYRS